MEELTIKLTLDQAKDLFEQLQARVEHYRDLHTSFSGVIDKQWASSRISSVYEIQDQIVHGMSKLSQ